MEGIRSDKTREGREGERLEKARGNQQARGGVANEEKAGPRREAHEPRGEEHQRVEKLSISFLSSVPRYQPVSIHDPPLTDADSSPACPIPVATRREAKALSDSNPTDQTIRIEGFSLRNGESLSLGP